MKKHQTHGREISKSYQDKLVVINREFRGSCKSQDMQVIIIIIFLTGIKISNLIENLIKSELLENSIKK